MSGRVIELRFPLAGIARRSGHRDGMDARGPHPTPWAVNVRPEDTLARRLRGGSRPGLTKVHAAAVGTSIHSIASVRVGSDTGVRSLLAILADSTLSVLEDGTLSTPLGALVTEDGTPILTDDDEQILLTTTDAPETAFLVTGRQRGYAVTDSAIYEYDPATGVLTTITASAGAIPTGVTHGCVYRDRLVLAGGDNCVYLSRQGDFTDWDYGAVADDPGRAMLLQLSQASRVGDICTALMPHDDRSMILGTQRSLWLLRGDPGAGGTLAQLREHVGVIAPGCWCEAEGAFFFLAEDGLYQTGPEGGELRNLTEDRMPQEMQNLDLSEVTVSCVYDPQATGLHLYLDKHWFYCLRTQSFWQVAMDSDHAPVAACIHDGQVVLACSDGYLRTPSGGDDDGTEISSHVLLGPLRLGAANDFGMILNLHGMTATGSGTCTWRIITGNTPEEAAERGKAAIEARLTGGTYTTYVKASNTWTAGRTYTAYPRVRAMYAVLWLECDAPWAWESATMEITRFGRWR